MKLCNSGVPWSINGEMFSDTDGIIKYNSRKEIDQIIFYRRARLRCFRSVCFIGTNATKIQFTHFYFLLALSDFIKISTSSFSFVFLYFILLCLYLYKSFFYLNFSSYADYFLVLIHYNNLV